MTTRFLQRQLCRRGTLLALLLVVCQGPASRLPGVDLEQAFRTPPAGARPWVYWFWENGSISGECITADLEAMHRVGIGGAVVMSVPHLPAGPVKFFSPEWRALLKHAVSEANRLGLELALTNGDGATGSGGPWIRPDEAMQELVWSESRLESAAESPATLPQPPTKLDFYRDVAVLAFPTDPDDAMTMAGHQPKLTASFTPFNGRALIDGKPISRVNVPAPVHGVPSFVQLEFDKPFRAGAITIDASGFSEAELHVSDDGEHFRAACRLELPRKSVRPGTFAFSEVTARYYRLVFPMTGPRGRLSVLRDVELWATPRLNQWERKAGFAEGSPSLFSSMPLPTSGNTKVVRRDQVVNLTNKMTADGRLKAELPPGRWTVLRIGFTPTGVETHSATAEGKGLECDKLSPLGIQSQFTNFVEKVLHDLGPFVGKTVRYGHIDSWEVGSQNWTAALADEFRKRRNYDMLPYLPVMAGGRVVNSPEVSERFLWDVRRTLGELLVENYFGRMRQLCHAQGLDLEAEATGPGIRTTADQLQCKARADIPMGEFWLSPTGQLGRDCKEAASSAHIGGKAIAGAEAFTSWPTRSSWQNDPFRLKPYGDRAFCAGINRLTFLGYVHQPWQDRAPGLTLGPFGTELNRLVTWWDLGRPWIEYLTRCQSLLQQGHFIGDICYFIGEGAPVGLANRDDLKPAPPPGYDYDGCDLESLLQMSVQDGRLTLPHGMTYRVLALPDCQAMTPQCLRKVRELVEAGATVVVGGRPTASPSLEDYPACDRDVGELAGAIWGDCDGQGVKERACGRGRVFCGTSLEEALALLSIPPDFQASEGSPSAVGYIHRRTEDADLYFVANSSSEAMDVTCRFRVAGKRPEFWHPDTGRIEPAAAFNMRDGRTTVPIHFDPAGSLFVVFRKPTAETVRVAPSPAPPHTVLDIKGSWEVSFPPNLGAPAKITLDKLASWSHHAEPGVKYFSGTATYRKTFDIPRTSPGAPCFSYAINLGVVKNLAEIRLNGRPLGILWKPPFAADATEAIQPGENHLELRITNLWPNRLIGDEQLPDDCQWNATGGLESWPSWLLEGRPSPTGRRTFATWKFYKKNSPLLPSGLLGPVTLEMRTIQEANQ